MCPARGHNTVPPVMLVPAILRSQVKHSITEALRPQWGGVIYNQHQFILVDENSEYPDQLASDEAS